MLSQKIHEDLIVAMKSGDTGRRDVLRFLEADIKKKSIDTRRELSDEEVQKAITSQIKSRKDSIAQFRSGGREDLAEPEVSAIAILEAYLPEQMSDEDLGSIVRGALAESGVDDLKDMGRAMGAVMPKVAGRADGNRVKDMVIKVLTK